MTDTTVALLGGLLFVLVPVVVICLPFIWYGRRHGWGPRQYVWPTIGIGIGCFVVLFGWFFEAPIDRVLMIAAMAGLPLVLLTTSLILVQRSMARRQTPKWCSPVPGTVNTPGFRGSQLA